MTATEPTHGGAAGTAPPASETDVAAEIAAEMEPNRRYNPYAGMDPGNPEHVEISVVEFQSMMKKKKAFGIPSLEVLKEKTGNSSNPRASDGKGGSSDEPTTAANDEAAEEKEEERPVPPPIVPTRWKKFLRMQQARVPDEAILQLANVQGFTPTPEQASELRHWLGMEESAATLTGNDDNATNHPPLAARHSSPERRPPRAPRSPSSPPSYGRFLAMQKQGIARAAILQSAQIQGEDCAKLARALDNEARKETTTTAAPAAEPPTGDETNDRFQKFARYVRMRREKGISVGFILEAARNQFVSPSESAELEKILNEVEPPAERTRNGDNNGKSDSTIQSSLAVQPEQTKGRDSATDALAVDQESVKSSKWFTPIPREKEPEKEGGDEENDDEEDNETVAFHRPKSSPLAALVRKLAHTVAKSSRRSGSTHKKRGHKAGSADDLVVDAKTLYHALGSFQGIQIAIANYNETLVTPAADSAAAAEKVSNAGWIRAKRQSFCEIAKSIGVKLPHKAKDGLVSSPRATVEGLDTLVRYIQDRYSDDIRESLTLLREDKLYDFDSLPALYVPGSRVVAKNICTGGVDMICTVSWNRIKTGSTITGRITKHLEVCFEFVVAVGTNQATIAEVVEGIDEFEGRRGIFSSMGLTFVPFMAYTEEEQESLLEKYRRRGRIYNEVALNCRPTNGRDHQNMEPKPTFSYKAYRKGCFFVKRGGFGGTVNPSSASRGMATGGKMVVDSQSAYEYGNSLGVGYDAMITGIHYKLKEYKLQQSRSSSEEQSGDHSDRYRGNKPYQASKLDNRHGFREADDDDSGMVLFDSIPEDYLDLVWPCVIGFSLTAKTWGECLVDGLEDIRFSEDAFDRLVLADDRKRLIKALVKHSSLSSQATTSSTGRHTFQDLIKGKGEGTVFLLYGPPGVGKTLTAEAVAEVLKRPLYSLSMGTLGTTADDLERRLSAILKLSAKWDAIILLDEADSFMEKRSSTSSLERNAMVCVMLQLVEYFSGILFLTSNRMDSLDPAFQTRITLSLPYHALADTARQKIWDNLLHKSGHGDSASLPIIDTKELAQHPLNGREIKNALRLALALASEEDRPLSHELLMETSSMVKPISAFGKGEDCSDPLPVPKPSFMVRFFVPAFLGLFLLLQHGVWPLWFTVGINNNGMEIDKDEVNIGPRRLFLFHRQT